MPAGQQYLFFDFLACLYGLVVLGGSFIVANAGSMVTQVNKFSFYSLKYLLNCLKTIQKYK